MSTISIFPKFTRLELSHKEEVEALTGQYDSYSDFNFTSLFSWDVDESAHISLVNRSLVIKLPHYLTGQPIFSILGDRDIDASIETLINTAGQVELVPQVVINNLRQPSKYIVIEDRDNYDYIYDLSMLANMEGGDYKKKRNKVNRILALFGARISTLTTNTYKVAPELKNGFEQWITLRGKTEDEAAPERSALHRLLLNATSLDTLTTLISIDGQLCGFSINEPLRHGYAICHFEKTISAQEGMQTFLANTVARELLNRGYTKINWEQDLGIPGLRQDKLSYSPERFLKKYTIRRTVN